MTDGGTGSVHEIALRRAKANMTYPVSTVAMQIMFPLLINLGFHSQGKGWHAPIGRDAAAWHINAFAILSFIDRVLRRQSEDMVHPLTTLHHQKGLQIIRERLNGDDEGAKISDATIGVVLKLATAAQFGGYVEVAQQHMLGLWRMVELRGGVRFIRDSPKLLVEIWRLGEGR